MPQHTPVSPVESFSARMCGLTPFPFSIAVPRQNPEREAPRDGDGTSSSNGCPSLRSSLILASKKGTYGFLGNTRQSISSEIGAEPMSYLGYLGSGDSAYFQILPRRVFLDPEVSIVEYNKVFIVKKKEDNVVLLFNYPARGIVFFTFIRFLRRTCLTDH